MWRVTKIIISLTLCVSFITIWFLQICLTSSSLTSISFCYSLCILLQEFSKYLRIQEEMTVIPDLAHKWILRSPIKFSELVAYMYTPKHPTGELQLPQMLFCHGRERKKKQLQGSSPKLPVKELTSLDFDSHLFFFWPVKNLIWTIMS